MSDGKKKEAIKKNDSLKEGITNYLKGVRSEWGKITWPERRQVFAETIIVLGVVLFFTVLVYILDIIFRGLLGIIQSK